MQYASSKCESLQYDKHGRLKDSWEGSFLYWAFYSSAPSLCFCSSSSNAEYFRKNHPNLLNFGCQMDFATIGADCL